MHVLPFDKQNGKLRQNRIKYHLVQQTECIINKKNKYKVEAQI